MISSPEQDFADRYYSWFGGRQHFAYLTVQAKKYGVGVCEEVIGEMKQDFGFNDKTKDARIKYFHKVLWNKQSNSKF